MWKKTVLIVSLALNVLLVSLLIYYSGIWDSSGPGVRSKPEIDGYVPDSLTAIGIAKAVWLPVYGTRVRNHDPFYASLIGDTVWRVSGSKFSSLIDWELSGFPFADIRKSDGKIIRTGHTK